MGEASELREAPRTDVGQGPSTVPRRHGGLVIAPLSSTKRPVAERTQQAPHEGLRSQAPALTRHSTESRAEPRETQPNTRSRLLTPRNLNCPRSPRPAGRLADPADGQTRISTVRGLPCRAAEIRSARKRKREFARRTEEQRHLEQAPKETHAEQAPGSSPPRAHGSAAAGHVGGCW